MRLTILAGFLLGFVSACGDKESHGDLSDAAADAGKAGCMTDCVAAGAFCWLGACVKLTAVTGLLGAG